MPSKAEIFRLISELKQDAELLRELAEQNERALNRIYEGEADDLDYAALGYTIHNIYSLLENYALRIAKVFENEIGDSSWHRELIKRMTLDIEAVRPLVWDRKLAGHIDELRRFRHAFRHIYDTKLDPEKLMIAQKYVKPAVDGALKANDDFIEKISLLAKNLE